MRRIRNVAVALLLAALLLSLGGCQKEVPAPPDGPVTELAYPGTYWTMSPDQVKDALSLPASGLPEDEQPADPDTGDASQLSIRHGGLGRLRRQRLHRLPFPRGCRRPGLLPLVPSAYLSRWRNGHPGRDRRADRAVRRPRAGQ